MTTSKDLLVRNLSAGYDSANVIEGISIEVERGKVTSILGANGAGKSTLIRTITGLLPRRGGTVSFRSLHLSNYPAHKLASIGISTVPEGNRVFAKMTVLENLLVGAVSLRERSVRDHLLCEQFSLFPRLHERRDQLAGTLSGGERSMLAIARSLMAKPEMIILDEPTLGLSPLFVTQVFSIVRTLRTRGVTVLLVEQNVRQTLDVSDYGYVLSQGRVTTQGRPAELIENSDLRAAYFGLAEDHREEVTRQ